MAPRPRRQPQQNDAAGRNRQAQAAPPLAERSCDRRVRSALPHKADTFAAAIYGPGDPRTAGAILEARLPNSTLCLPWSALQKPTTHESLKSAKVVLGLPANEKFTVTVRL